MLRRNIAIILALALPVLPGVATVNAQQSSRLEQVERELREQRRLAQQAEARRKGALARISESDARRQTLAARVQELAGELASAEERLDIIRGALEEARRQLRRSAGELKSTEARLGFQRDSIAQRAATAYKLGPGGYLEVMLGASDLRALIDRASFVDRVFAVDTRVLSGIETTRGLVGDMRERVKLHSTDLRDAQSKVEEEIERVEQLKAEQESLLSEVDNEIEIRRDLLGDIEASKAAYDAAVRELEAESARIRSAIQGGGSTGSGNPNARFHWPTAGSIGSGYGWRVHPIFGTRRFHSGVDIGAPCGQAIWAGENGKVIVSGWQGGYGNTVVIDHGKGLSTLYAHQSSMSVGVGQQVSRAQRIGSIGTTGWSTGCHLHFEVRVNGNPVNPMPYLS